METNGYTSYSQAREGGGYTWASLRKTELHRSRPRLQHTGQIMENKDPGNEVKVQRQRIVWRLLQNQSLDKKTAEEKRC